MVESTIDKIKDITVERQIRKLAGVIDEQNQKIDVFKEATTEINNLKESDANQTTQINNLKQSVATDKLATESAITALQNKDTEQDGTLTNHATLIQGITESLVSAVQIMPGTTAGEIKVRIDRESAASIDSNNYNLGLPVSAEIIQGTGPSMFKVQITMSSGVKVISNDFVFTTEAIGNDVYISSFTFKAGNQNGYLSADIGLNNGVTIEANNFLVPTDPNVTSAITDLQTRLTTVENSGVSDISGLKATVDGHTASINALDSDVSALQIDKADVTNTEQIITNKRVDTEIVRYKYNATDAYGIQGTGTETDPFLITGKKTVAGKEVYVPIGKIAVLNSDGNPTNFTSGGGTIINLSSFDGLKNGDIILITSLSTEGSSLALSQFFGMYRDSTIYGWGGGKSANTKVYISKILLRSPTDIAIYYYNDGSNSNNFSNTTVKSVSGLKVTF